MSKHLESKDHTIRRLRGQRDILRRVAQAPVKELQENDDSGKEERAYAKVVQDTVDSEKGKKLRKYCHLHEQQPQVLLKCLFQSTQRYGGLRS